MATLIKSNGTTLEVFPANKKDFTVEELQSLVGGYFERVPMRSFKWKDVPSHMLCNEDGRALELDINIKASNIYGDIIVGNVLIVNDIEFQ